MNKLLKIIMYLPMPLIGIYYGIYFSIPGDSDTIPFASMLTGIILVAVPMLFLSILNVFMFIISIKYNMNIEKKVRSMILLGGMLTPVLAFLWLYLISSFTVYAVTGIYVLISFVSGSILFLLNKRNTGNLLNNSKFTEIK